MTKKRFIKLLMSRGKSRNEAVEIALNYNNLNYSYRKAYLDYLFKYSIRDAFNTLAWSESVSKLSEAFSKLSEAFSKSTISVGEI